MTVQFHPSNTALVRQVYAKRNPASAADIQAAYGISSSLAQKVYDTAVSLNIDPAHLANVIHFESAYKWRPDVENTSYRHQKCGGGYATGLIQFIPCTAQGLGTSLAALKAMTAEQQMDYVKKYFADVIREYGPLRTQEDVYMAVFHPKAIGKPDYRFSDEIAAANKGIRYPADYVKLANAKARMSSTAISTLTAVGLSGETARTIVSTSAQYGPTAIGISLAVSTAMFLVAGAIVIRRSRRK